MGRCGSDAAAAGAGGGHERTVPRRGPGISTPTRDAVEEPKLQISAGALLSIVSASHVLSGVIDGDLASKGLSMFGLVIGIYVAAHCSVLLAAKRALQA
jgi:hypothetical protein